MAIHLSLRVAPLDLQQGGNSRIPYVHVPAARMSSNLLIKEWNSRWESHRRESLSDDDVEFTAEKDSTFR
ncbi:hypothetical protein RND71_007999 [Anisodus tanguticus]|uniref:Uncharacterized protein n=1 Tax=Anisodus tanguticus TaxID=243964 RepID=A0AAE1SME8_9SOLA|nr:hypothetical protein RND71_007999 [Anisodus tanguticus]